jgi:hypothetical protein
MGLVRLKPGANFGRVEPRGTICGIGEVDQRRFKADDQHTRLCHHGLLMSLVVYTISTTVCADVGE